MSAPLDIAAQNAALDALLGDNAASTMPSSFEVALFDGDPSGTGAELSSTGGYARVTVANDSAQWPDASGGAKTSAPVSFAASTDAWSVAATHWVLYDAADSTTAYFYGAFTDEFVVTVAGVVVEPELSLYWNTF